MEGSLLLILHLGERYVYKFVCDPDALFQMALAENHRNALKAEAASVLNKVNQQQQQQQQTPAPEPQHDAQGEESEQGEKLRHHAHHLHHPHHHHHQYSDMLNQVGYPVGPRSRLIVVHPSSSQVYSSHLSAQLHQHHQRAASDDEPSIKSESGGPAVAEVNLARHDQQACGGGFPQQSPGSLEGEPHHAHHHHQQQQQAQHNPHLHHDDSLSQHYVGAFQQPEAARAVAAAEYPYPPHVAQNQSYHHALGYAALQHPAQHQGNQQGLNQSKWSLLGKDVPLLRL